MKESISAEARLEATMCKNQEFLHIPSLQNQNIKRLFEIILEIHQAIYAVLKDKYLTISRASFAVKIFNLYTYEYQHFSINIVCKNEI